MNSSDAGIAIEPPPHDPLSDTRIRHLLSRYAPLAQTTLTQTAPGLLELRVPAGDRAHFGRRDRITVAFSLGALSR